MYKTVHVQIAENKRKTVGIVTGFILFLIFVGAVIGHIFYENVLLGIIYAVFLSILYTVIMLINSSSIVMRMNRARKITKREKKRPLWDAVENMAMVANIPLPDIYIIDDRSPNAFATGTSPKKAAVAVTTGLLEQLDDYELEGVIAHEVSHIKNYDIRLATVAIALVSAIAVLSDIAIRSLYYRGGYQRSNNNRNKRGQLFLLLLGLIFIIITPVIATMIQLAISRNREYLADASAVELTRNPVSLISALEKISSFTQPVAKPSKASESIYFVNPFKKVNQKLFATHPPIEDRIARLKEM